MARQDCEHCANSQRGERRDPRARLAEPQMAESPQATWYTSPFCDRIARQVLGRGEHFPDMPSYDGTGDPVKHIQFLDQKLIVCGFSSDIRARLFAFSLTGVAEEWFSRIPDKSINSLEQLKEMFQNQFVLRIQTKLHPIHLFTIRQGEHETLRKYMNRFNLELMKVEATTVDLVLAVLFECLKHEELVEILYIKEPKTISEINELARTVIRLEETRRTTAAARLAQGGNRNEDDKRNKPWRKENEDRKRGKTPPRGERFANHTPLNMDVGQIYADIESKGLVQKARKFRETRETQSSSRFCKYHNQKGHNTRDCIDLKNEIERLIQEGQLVEYVLSQQHAHGGDVRRDRSRSPRNHGKRLVGPSQLSAEQLDSKVTFDDTNLQGLSSEAIETGYLNCPLVVSVDIGKHLVKRVLIDNCSSANIIFVEALRRMHVEDYDMTTVNTPVLHGFGGGEVHPLGKLVLPTSFGTYPCRRTLNLEFLVVDVPSMYNVIIGRPGLVEFMAVISTVHQKIKFPTSAGVGEIVSDLR